MSILPYTVSQTAFLMTAMYVGTYLGVMLLRGQLRQQRATCWMLAAVWFSAFLMTGEILSTVFEHPVLDFLPRMRNLLILALFYSLIQVIYAQPPEDALTAREEQRVVRYAFMGFIGFEAFYLGYRIWLILGEDAWPQGLRPVWAQSGILITSLWLALLPARKLLAAEGVSPRFNLRSLGQMLKAFYRPQSDTSRMMRWLLVILVTISAMTLVNTTMAAESRSLVIPILADLVSISTAVSILFIYLRFQIEPMSLEIRMTGGGLALFLGSVYILGWLLTIVFLHQAAPGVPVIEITGHFQAINYQPAPEYEVVAAQLHNLLTPLFYFEIVGGMLFALAFTIYYRRYMGPGLKAIMTGLEYVELGNYEYRIAKTSHDEYGRIADTFNHMSATLRKANAALLSHQEDLEGIIESRTEALAAESEQRRVLQVRNSVQQERERIARETHDTVLQSLAGIGMRLRSRSILNRAVPAGLTPELKQLADEARNAAQELRRLINDLDAEILNDGMDTALLQVVELIRRRHFIHVDVDVSYDLDTLSVTQAIHILRVVQEAMQNACVHGSAANIAVQICPQTPQAFMVQIEDDGQGFDVEAVGLDSWGLRNMRQRATRLGAKLTVESEPGVGTTVTLQIPRDMPSEFESPARRSTPHAKNPPAVSEVGAVLAPTQPIRSRSFVRMLTSLF